MAMEASSSGHGAMLLPKRATRGKRMKQLMDEEQEADEEFWNQEALREEEEDVEFEAKDNEIQEDEFDSDFDEDESENEEEVEDEVREKKKKKAPNSKAKMSLYGKRVLGKKEKDFSSIFSPSGRFDIRKRKLDKYKTKSVTDEIKSGTKSEEIFKAEVGGSVEKVELESKVVVEENEMKQNDSAFADKEKESEREGRSGNKAELQSDLEAESGDTNDDKREEERNSESDADVEADSFHDEEEETPVGERRKSKRSAVVVRDMEREFIHLLSSSQKPAKKKKKDGRETRISQEEMLKQAAWTEIYNCQLLEKMKAREEQVKKKAILKNKSFEGPKIRYVSRNGQNFIQFTETSEFPTEINDRIVNYPEKVKCVVTGLPAKYREPMTNLPYATKEAYAIIKQKFSQYDVRWERNKQRQ